MKSKSECVVEVACSLESLQLASIPEVETIVIIITMPKGVSEIFHGARAGWGS